MASSSPLNVERIEDKIPELLIQGPTSETENFNDYRRNDYQLRRLKKKNPELYNQKLNAVVAALKDLKASLTADVKLEWGYGAVKRDAEREAKKQV